MRKINQIISQGVPLPLDEVDTDQIIPARFLKSTTKDGFGDNLMRDWRYDDQNQKIASFPLNDSRYSGSILVVGNNFGCGSSREHAAWAIADYGFQVIIAKSFADIFKNNALNNGILPIVIPAEKVDQLIEAIQKDPQITIRVNLGSKVVEFLNQTFPIEINDYKRTCLMNGFDDIDYLINMRAEIETFEKQYSRF